MPLKTSSYCIKYNIFTRTKLEGIIFDNIKKVELNSPDVQLYFNCTCQFITKERIKEAVLLSITEKKLLQDAEEKEKYIEIGIVTQEEIKRAEAKFFLNYIKAKGSQCIEEIIYKYIADNLLKQEEIDSALKEFQKTKVFSEAGITKSPGGIFIPNHSLFLAFFAFFGLFFVFFF